MRMRKRDALAGWKHDETSESATLTRPVVQRTDEGARRLGDRYWVEVARASRGLVRPRRTATGVELRALGVGPVLLRLAGPEVVVDADCVSCRYHIVGGLLARAPAGVLTLTQSPSELRAAVTEYSPRLGPGLYRLVQRRFHVAVSRRYFGALIAEAQR
jgi:hypothetical protein